MAITGEISNVRVVGAVLAQVQAEIDGVPCDIKAGRRYDAALGGCVADERDVEITVKETAFPWRLVHRGSVTETPPVLVEALAEAREVAIAHGSLTPEDTAALPPRREPLPGPHFLGQD